MKTRKPTQKKLPVKSKKTAAPSTKKKTPARKGKVSARKPKAPSRNRAAKKPLAKKPLAKKQPATTRENPQAQALARRIAALLVEKKAADVVILNLLGMTSYTDYVVVASGDSDRQVTAMADYVEATLKQEGGHRTLGTEGQQAGNWVLLDYGDVVAHLFLADTRSFYDLEGQWTDAPRERVA